MQWFWTIPLLGTPLLVAVLTLTLLLATFVVRQRAAETPKSLRWALSGAGAGALLFGTTTWLVADVFTLFGDFVLSFATTAWVVFAGAFIGLAIGALATPGERRRWWHQLTAAGLVFVSVVAAGLGVNRDIGYFVSPDQILTMFTTTDLPSLPELNTADAVALTTDWTPPSDMPEEGKLVQALVPPEQSGFKARPAIVYLPPAALTAHPPRLPLLVTFSGQPGSPQDVFNSGHLTQILEEYQKSHGGLAPIVVSPDQLGTPQSNPMCFNSKLGQNETYLIDDVIPWIRTNLPVAQDATHTAFMGFSQGATCTIQLGFGHPDVVDTLVPISPQLEPTIGSRTVQRAFDGDQAKFDANTPLARLKAQGNFPHMSAAFYVGEDDAKYSAWSKTLVEAARQHGVDATLIYSPGTGHNWHTAVFAIKSSFPFIISNLGLPQ